MKRISIGRNTANDLIVDDASVSRVHAELIIYSDGRISISDLNSKNGTYLNGKRILQPEILNPDDIVSIGNKQINWERFLPEKTNFSKEIVSDSKPFSSGILRSIAIPAILIAIITSVFLLSNKNNLLKSETIDTDTILSDPKPDDKTVSGASDGLNKVSVGPSPEISEQGKTSSVETGEIIRESKIEPDLPIQYDFACLNDGNDQGVTEIVTDLSLFEDEMLNSSNTDLTIKDELKAGNSFHSEMQNKYAFVKSGSSYDNLNKILTRLVQSIEEPQGFNYKIYLFNSEEINAFTIGGRIYITTSMYNFCKSNDELACIIGHEIGHNELKHIRQQLQKEYMVNSIFGNELGGNIGVLNMVLTTPFNQVKETASDMFGIDLVFSAGFNACSTVSIWNRMKENEDAYNPVTNLFRSHPYSEKRAVCCKHHISSNYRINPCNY